MLRDEAYRRYEGKPHLVDSANEGGKEDDSGSIAQFMERKGR